MSVNLVSSFRERLREELEVQGLSGSEFAKMIDMSKQAISAYLTGVRIPKRMLMIGIAKKLNVNPMWIMGYDVDKHLPENIIPIEKAKRAPLIGQIACGQPIFAEENIESYIPYPSFIEADFCLKCKGDSMIGSGINDGDIIFIRKQSDVEDGEVAAIQIGVGEECEATLKRIYHGHNKITLVPDNPKFQNMIYTNEELNEIEIIGKAVWKLGPIK